MTQQYPPQPQQPYGSQPGPQGGYPQQQYAPPQQYVPPPKKRKVWPWVLLAVVLIPVLGLVSCVALLGAGAKAVDNARQGGTVKIGETFTYQSGLAITVAAPKAYDADNQYIVDPTKEVGYEATVTVVNGTRDAVGASLITVNATVGNAPAQQIFTDNALPTQQIAPGQQLQIPFRFKTTKDASGPLQIAVTDTFNEPVFFTGTL